jgi:predicted NACHT family NTPase
MDTFNITQLALLTVKKQNMTKTIAKSRENIADKLLKVLQSNTTIVAERGLNVYGFQHLSYQEYFVAQFLVRSHFTDERGGKENIRSKKLQIVFFSIQSILAFVIHFL